MVRARGRLALLVWLTLVPTLGAAEVLRVGTSGDYAPFSRVSGDASDASDAGPRYAGFDIDVARAYAEERGLELVFVRFAWPELLADLAAGRFDVAMSGITVRPERSAAGRFTHPVAEGGAVVLVNQPNDFPDLASLNRRVARIGVNAGGHLEQVAEARFPRATRVAIPDNAAVLAAFRAGRVQAALTDSFEAPSWRGDADGVTLLGPFTRDRKAYLVRPDRPELAADLDAWLLARERDGRLQTLRDRHFGAAGRAGLTPLQALVAAVDERLALMPLVGLSKRRAGQPLEVPEREVFVIDAAVGAVDAAATRSGAPAPPQPAVRSLFRALIDAAKEVQWAAIKDPDLERPDRIPDIDADLRPALIRIGDRISQLLLALPAGLDPAEVERAARDGLRTPRLSEHSTREIANAIANLSAALPASVSAAGEAAGDPAGH